MEIKSTLREFHDLIVLVIQGLHSNEEESISPGCREHDRFLPIANISRIMKRTLPPNAKIAKDAKDIVQECVSEFISFITSEYVVSCWKATKRQSLSYCY